MRIKKPKKESRIGLLLLYKENSEYICIIVVTRGLISLDGIIVEEGVKEQLVQNIISQNMFKQVSFIVPLSKDSEELAKTISSRTNVIVTSSRELVGDNPEKKILYNGYTRLALQFMEKLISLKKNKCKTN